MMDEAGFPAVRRANTAAAAAPVRGDASTKVSRQGQDSILQRWWDVASCVVAGLASSSCCLLQLALNGLSSLNVLHVGCAGFNKTLGPIRMPLRAVSLTYLGGLWIFSIRKGSNKHRLLLNTLLTFALMFLPEILKLSGGPA